MDFTAPWVLHFSATSSNSSSYSSSSCRSPNFTMLEKQMTQVGATADSTLFGTTDIVGPRSVVLLSPTCSSPPPHRRWQRRTYSDTALWVTAGSLDDVEDSGTWIDWGTATTVTWYTIINIDNINITIVNSSIQHIHVNNIWMILRKLMFYIVKFIGLLVLLNGRNSVIFITEYVLSFAR